VIEDPLPPNDPRHTEPEAFDLPDQETRISCPYCGSDVLLLLDPGGASRQEYVEDCEVCCRPWHLTVSWDRDGHAWVEARTEED
jgi:hypothetical protein